MLDSGPRIGVGLWRSGDAMGRERLRAFEVEGASSNPGEVRSDAVEGRLSERLAAMGYRVASRVDGFAECLVVGADERWLGRGTTVGEALEDALAQMLPSRLARALWEARAEASPAAEGAADRVAVAEVAEVAARPRAPAEVPVADAAAPDVAAPEAPAPEAPTDGAPIDAVDGAVVERDAAAPAAEGAAAQDAPPEAVAAPSEEAEGPPQSTVASPSADQAVVVTRPTPRRGNEAAAPPPGPDRTPTLAKLVSLQNRLQRDRARLALLAPDDLRLEMLHVICQARAFTDLHPQDGIVERAVGDVARDLTDLGKLWWPGSVRALQLKAAPADIVRDIEPRPSERPESWAEAAALAGRVLARRRDGGGGGWADDAECVPAPPDASQLLSAAAKVAQDKGASDAVVLDAARKVRWLRPVIGEGDAEAWGEVIGKLRQRADRGGSAALRAVLDPSYRPAGNWAREVGQDPAAKQLKKRRAKLLRAIPRADASAAEVAAWLSEAFELGDELPNPKIAACTGHLEALILGLAEDDLPVDERRHRKRLRSLQLIFDGVEVPEDDLDDDDDEDDDLEDDAGTLLLALVREKVVGQRALLLSNRADPGLERQLEDALGLDLTMSLVDPRRRQAAATAVENGTYALVLAAHRFIGHDVDKDIGQKAKAGGIPYVRVGSGRVGSVVRALAREVGVQV